MPELSCILLARPNGSGKSSAFAKLDLEGVWINADEIAKAIPSDHDGRSTNMLAGRAALLKIAEMIETRQSFIFETTLGPEGHLLFDRLDRNRTSATCVVGPN